MSKPSPLLTSLGLISELAALTHDVGKAPLGFQEKLRLAQQGENPGADPVRHELISVFMLQPLVDRLHESNWNDLQTTESIREFFENEVREHLASCQAPYIELRDRLATMDDATRHDVLSGRHIGFEYPDFETKPFEASWLWLVLTHHRLPANQYKAEVTRARRGRASTVTAELHATALNYVNTSNMDKLEQFFVYPESGEGLPWHNAEWLNALAKLIRKGQRRLNTAPKLNLNESHPWITAMMYMARPAVVMGDHVASSLKEPTTADCYANTLKRFDDNNKFIDVVMADPLGVHLNKTLRWTSELFSTLFGRRRNMRERLPRLDREEYPELMKNDSPDPYGWQNALAPMGRSARPSKGFLGLLTAATGSGKTRGCLKMMAEVEGHRGLRVTLGLGLRTLADQGHRDYMGSHIELPESSVQRLVGSYFPIPKAEETAGDGASEGGRGALFSGDGETIDDDAFTRMVTEGLIGKLAPKPVSVMTIDHIISAISLQSGKDCYLAHHLMQTDLILDEIDNLDSLDLVWMQTLVFLMGFYGRKVVLSSATLNAVISDTFAEAYRDGFGQFQALYGKKVAKLAVVSADAPYYKVDDIGECPSSLRRTLEVEQGELPENMRHRTAVLNVMNSAMGPGDLPDVYENMAKAASRLTDMHKVPVAKDMDWSAGFVRFNNVDATQNFSLFIAANRHRLFPDAHVEVVCYHSKTTAVERYIVEHHLNELMKRDKKGHSKAYSPDVKEARDAFYERARAAGKSKAILLVITTQIIEVGRDHDYDWCVLEPASLSSFLQSIGRVLRHRRSAEIAHSTPNIVILNRTLKSLSRHIFPASWSYPGVETPSPLHANRRRVDPDYPMQFTLPVEVDGRMKAMGIDTKSTADGPILEAEDMLGECLASPDNRVSLNIPAHYRNLPEHSLKLLELRDHLQAGESPAGMPRFRIYNGGNIVKEDRCKLAAALGQSLHFRHGDDSETVFCETRSGRYHNSWRITDKINGGTETLPRGVDLDVLVEPFKDAFYGEHLDRGRYLEQYRKRFSKLPSEDVAALLFSVSLNDKQKEKSLYFSPHLGMRLERI